MEMDLAFIRRFFKGFYHVILAFVALTAVMFIFSYFAHISTTNEYVYNLQADLLALIEQDLETVDYKVDDPAAFYEKYNTAHLKLVDSILIIDKNNKAFFVSNTKRIYLYKGIDKNRDILLSDIVLKKNMLTTKRMADGTEVIIISKENSVSSLVAKDWLNESRIQFIVSILIPLIVFLVLILIEEHLIKDLENRFLRYFRAIEEKNKEKQELYWGLYQNNRCVMMLVDPETGWIIDGNDSAVEYYGYRFNDQPVKIMDINTLPVSDVEKVMSDAVENKRNYFLFKHKLANGMLRDVEVYTGPVVMEGRTVLCSIIHDVTDKVHAEQNLLNQQLEMEQKILEKSEVLAMISHEIKTPIAGILQNVNELMCRIEDEILRKEIQFLKLNVNNLNRLVFDLLDYSRLDTGNLKFYSAQFDLVDVLETSAKLFEPLAQEKSVRIILELQSLNKRRFVGDAYRIGQIINNLISNSIKYTHNGDVRISAADEKMDNQSLVTIIVEDTGIGMKPETIEQVFKRFYTTDYTGEHVGTGLGLSICRMIIEAMSGTIEIESTPQKGTKVILTLELYNDDAVDFSAIEASMSESQQQGSAKKEQNLGTDNDKVSKIRILNIDDDPMSLLFVEKLLRQVNFLDVNIDSAYNGKEALEKLETISYEAIISDYHLPDISGDELVKKVKVLTNQKGIRFIMVSADFVENADSSIDAFLMKPVEPDALEKVLRKLFLSRHPKKERFAVQNNQFIGTPELEELLAYIGKEELKSVLEIFTKGMEEKYKTLPVKLQPENVNGILNTIHGIRGSISYFKSEIFFDELTHVETVLRSNQDFQKQREAYKRFYEAIGQLIKEAKIMAQFVDILG